MLRSGVTRLSKRTMLLFGSASTAALSLNFLSGALDSRVTFTRPSTATYFNSSGVMSSVAINTARFDYNPNTLAALGLLLEEQRTNLLLNSLIDGTILSTQSVAVSVQAYTLSFYGTGTVTLTGASTAGPLAGTGANNLVQLTFTPSAGSVAFTVSGTVKWANLEAGPFATSFIPTTGATATRSGDIATVPLTGIWNDPAGTVFEEFSLLSNVASADLPRVSNGTLANVMAYYTNAGSLSSIIGYFQSGGVAQTITAPGSVDLTLNTKLAWAYSGTSLSRSINGAAAVTDAGYALPTGINQMYLGTQGAIGGSFSGHIKTITYYNTRKTNAELQALST